MDADYKLHEFPSITNQQSIHYLYLFQQFIDPVNKLIEEITSSKNTSRTTLTLVMPILFRLVECSQSIVILLSKNRIRDASILLLNIYELRLDLLYISLNPAREEKWIDFNIKSSKPWKVGMQQKELFSDPDELEAEKNIYRNFSMIKHGNYAGKNSSFPISANKFGFFLAGSDPRAITAYVFALCGFLNSAVSASFIILRRHNNQFPEIEQKILKAYNSLSDASKNDFSEMAYELVFKNYPHLKDIPDIRNRLRVNIIPSGENEELTIEVTFLKK